MNILVISNSEWDDNNSFGNTFSNFFSGMEDVSFANIYCREGNPNTKMCSRFLCISDIKLFRHLFDRSVSPVDVKSVDRQENNSKGSSSQQSEINRFMRKKRWSIFYLAREVLWSLSDYKTDEFCKFIEDFKPDVLFLPTYPFQYINKMGLWISSNYHLKIISYMSDDEYSLRRLSFSPIFWIRRFGQRHWVIKALKKSNVVYVISNIQKQDCKKDLGIEAKILTKSYDFSTSVPVKRMKDSEVVKLLYAGNIGTGRWRSLVYIAEAVERLNWEGIKVALDIYTPTIITGKIERKLSNHACFLHKPIPYTQLKKIQEDSDVVIHVESLKYTEGLEVRQSFSTKLVDLFYDRCCIFAIGRKDEASIEHLLRNNAAVVALNKNEVYEKLKAVVTDRGLREQFSENAYQCGLKLHNKYDMNKMLLEDIKKCINSEDLI